MSRYGRLVKRCYGCACPFCLVGWGLLVLLGPIVGLCLFVPLGLMIWRRP